MNTTSLLNRSRTSLGQKLRQIAFEDSRELYQTLDVGLSQTSLNSRYGFVTNTKQLSDVVLS